MNINSFASRLSQPTHTVSRCVARHDGGYLVRLCNGRAAISGAPLATGERVVISEAGMAQVAR